MDKTNTENTKNSEGHREERGDLTNPRPLPLLIQERKGSVVQPYALPSLNLRERKGREWVRSRQAIYEPFTLEQL
jgi:hypothetical protein